MVLVHASNDLSGPKDFGIQVFGGLMKFGVSGVDFFFVLSGFLIGTILLVSLERQGRQMVGNFYVRRAFRIIPLY